MCNSQNEPQTAAIIPLGHASRRDSSSLPEGFQWTMTRVIVNGARSLVETLTHRAGPALPSYLALHHAGFSVPPMLPPGRWALTPPFHPCQTMRAIRRRLAGLPARCHRAALRRRYILCGTLRDACSRRALAQPTARAPWRYQARCPLPRACVAGEGFTPLARKRTKGFSCFTTQDGVRTFLPPSHLAMTKPAITRPARQLLL